jgi:hypothetical protein
MLPTQSHAYQITALKIQTPRHTWQPCALTQTPTSHKDTHILLGGTLTPKKTAITCSLSTSQHVVERIAHDTLNSGGTEPHTLLGKIVHAFKKGYAAAHGKTLVHFSYPGMVRYLTKLRTCSPGIVTAMDAVTRHPIVYHIHGQTAGHCIVTVKMPDQRTQMRCAFTPKQTRVIANKRYISMFSHGKLNINAHDPASKIYDKQCQIKSE